MNDNETTISDGYHTMQELYEHRGALFCLLMHKYKSSSWFSLFNANGQKDEGWLVAGIDLPSGVVSYHMETRFIPYLDGITELPRAKYWDGYTSKDVFDRLLEATKL